jgi:hypothetical protein
VALPCSARHGRQWVFPKYLTPCHADEPVQSHAPVQAGAPVQNPAWCTPVHSGVQNSALNNPKLQPSLSDNVAPEATPEDSAVPKVISEIDNIKQITLEEETHPKDAPATTAKRQSKKATKAEPATQTKEDVEQAINSLDLQKFRAKYSILNIEEELENFQDHFLCKNDLKSRQPNWKKWSDWNRAFHKWCRNSLKWNGNGSTPPLQPTTPTCAAHRPLD